MTVYKRVYSVDSILLMSSAENMRLLIRRWERKTSKHESDSRPREGHHRHKGCWG